MTADEIKALLQAGAAPGRGRLLPPDLHLGRRQSSFRAAARPAGTAIYYLLEPGTFSEMHVLASDEIFHFYLGDPVEMLQLYP